MRKKKPSRDSLGSWNSRVKTAWLTLTQKQALCKYARVESKFAETSRQLEKSNSQRNKVESSHYLNLRFIVIDMGDVWQKCQNQFKGNVSTSVDSRPYHRQQGCWTPGHISMLKGGRNIQPGCKWWFRKVYFIFTHVYVCIFVNECQVYRYVMCIDRCLCKPEEAPDPLERGGCLQQETLLTTEPFLQPINTHICLFNYLLWVCVWARVHAHQHELMCTTCM